METKELKLCELLKGHEGETFYSPVFGCAKLIDVKDNGCYQITITGEDSCKSYVLTSDLKAYDLEDAECILFPSKEQRDWNKWAYERKYKVPKTWSELVKLDSNKNYIIGCGSGEVSFTKDGCTPIEKSALALLKIHELIEVGYGGNITDEEWNNFDWKYKIYYSTENNKLIIHGTTYRFPYCVFHTKKQAEEFISYPENMKLVKQFYMID